MNSLQQAKLFVLPYTARSSSANTLAKALGCPRIKRQGSAFLGAANKVVINWGSCSYPVSLVPSVVLNSPTTVQKTNNKLTFFESVGGSARVPRFTTSSETALSWIDDGLTVMGRSLKRASGGRGIVFFDDNMTTFLDCSLFTEYVKKKEEYRVHIFNGNVIKTQKKVLRSTDDHGTPIDPSKVDFRVRSLQNGFIFQMHNINPPEDVIVQAQKAHKACGLDFGAYDVIWNEYREEAYVLEVNAAPGLEGTTVDCYTAAIKEYCNNL